METNARELEDGTFLVLLNTRASSGLAYLKLEPPRGYWVATEPVTERDLLEAALHDGAPAIVGVWTNGDGIKELDRARWMADKAEAIAEARLYNQRAIWDIAEGRAEYV